MIDYIKLAMNGWKLNELKELKKMNDSAMNTVDGAKVADDENTENVANVADDENAENGENVAEDKKIDINKILDEKRHEIDELKKQIEKMQNDNLHKNIEGNLKSSKDVLESTIKNIL